MSPLLVQQFKCFNEGSLYRRKYRNRRIFSLAYAMTEFSRKAAFYYPSEVLVEHFLGKTKR